MLHDDADDDGNDDGNDVDDNDDHLRVACYPRARVSHVTQGKAKKSKAKQSKGKGKQRQANQSKAEQSKAGARRGPAEGPGGPPGARVLMWTSPPALCTKED